MSIRNSLRRSLVGLDSRLGMREWLRQNDNAAEEQARPRPADPFAVAELEHPLPITVLDIGGSHGQFVKEAVRFFPGATIYSFEPIPECHEELLALRELVANLHPINLALGDRDGEQDLWLSAFRDSSSLHEMLPAHVAAWPHTEIEAKITVQIARLDAIAPILALKPPIFAKIDVQGHELAVIRGGRATLSLCERVMIECNFASLYQGQPTFDQLSDELHSLGFLFDGFISALRHPQTLEQLSADAVFYKPVNVSGHDNKAG
jgi:FkbM family methyltransferase